MEVCSRAVQSDSVGIAAPEELEDRVNEDAQVEPEAPILDVPKVAIDPLLHQLETGGFSAETIDLSPAGQAGLHVLPECVIGDELGVPVIVGYGMRSRTNDRHIAAQHVHELRQLVDAGGAQDCPDARDAWIPALRLTNYVAVFQYVHRAELEDGEL